MIQSGTEHLTDAEISDLADGALDQLTQRRLQDHLAVCERCAGEMRTTRMMKAWSSEQRAAVTAPPELWSLVAASTIHLRAVRRQVLRSMRGVLVLFALVLAVATAALTWTVAQWWFTSDEPQVRGVRVIGPGQHAGHPTTNPGSVAPPAPDPERGPRPPARPPRGEPRQ